MIGGLMKTTSRLAVAAAAGLFMGGVAHAGGSIGGDCCADLEERVAELEATTARKGNRVVSLTVYGQVNKAIVFSDEVADASGDDIAIIDNDLSESRFGFKGKAKISSDLYAGYQMEFRVGSDGGRTDDEGEDNFRVRINDLYIGSKTYGKVSLGFGRAASDNIAKIDLSGTKVAGGTDNLTGRATTGETFADLDGLGRVERIRYDTPTLAGFKVSASWTDSEDYDVALRYGSTLGDFTVAAGIAYWEEEEEDNYGGSISVKHVPTGLNLTFAAADSETDDTEYWYLKGGITRKVFAAGKTSLSVDYQDYEEGDVEFEKYGFQLVQKIDAAAMELYLSAWSTESDDGGAEEDVVLVGSRIKF